MNREISDKIGQYCLHRSLGKGGMGEVFLAFDPICERSVALKQIRSDLSKYKGIRERFLKEARIAAQLIHPSIIPIYSIYPDETIPYYTMPYVQGETLKEILKTTSDQAKNGEELHLIGSSIPHLSRLFLSVCQAIAYTHSKGFLHRDLKPENIIIGTYGEVFILDWGLADYIGKVHEDLDEGISIPLNSELTRPGKIVGTLTYLAPERALGESASVQTDIYSLGVILYQILTLRLPFQRTTIQNFKKHMKYERLLDPSEIAPYRDIPLLLAEMTKKCLDPLKDNRYRSMEELIGDLENYIAGKPEWIFASKLQIDHKNDWEFQENVLLAKHVAITRKTDVMEWVSLMISQSSFSGNIKIEAEVRFDSLSGGLGILIGIPQAADRKGLEEGYCLWISPQREGGCKFFRSNVEVASFSNIEIQDQEWIKIQIEKVDNHLKFFLKEHLYLDYTSHIPLTGTHVGVLYRDDHFELKDLKVFVSGQNAMVNCLAVPDAFLMNKDFSTALIEYRRIAHCFPGRIEGREALFRAGLALLEEGITKKNKRERGHLFLLALDEFDKLRSTPGAPLEYLGKSLVYKANSETEEEIKCLELAIRKYARHPLLQVVAEHIVFRLHEASDKDRFAAYHFALLSLRHLPYIFSNPDNQKLIESLKKHWEPLPFIDSTVLISDLLSQNILTAIQLAFWLAKPITLIEIIENAEENVGIIHQALLCLIELDCSQWIKRWLLTHQKRSSQDFRGIEIIVNTNRQKIKDGFDALFSEKNFDTFSLPAFFYLAQRAIDQNKTDLIYPLFDKIPRENILPSEKVRLDVLKISVCLIEHHLVKAEEILFSYPLDYLSQEMSPFYFIFGCYLVAKGEKEAAMNHFSSVSDTKYPCSSSLIASYLQERIDLKKGWISRSFFWERVQLLRQLILFYQCSSEYEKSFYFQKRLYKEYQHVKFR